MKMVTRTNARHRSYKEEIISQPDRYEREKYIIRYKCSRSASEVRPVSNAKMSWQSHLTEKRDNPIKEHNKIYVERIKPIDNLDIYARL